MAEILTRPDFIQDDYSPFVDSSFSPNQTLKNYKIELLRHALKNFRDKTPNHDLTGVEMLRELRAGNNETEPSPECNR